MNRFKVGLVAILIIFSAQIFVLITNSSAVNENISWTDPTLVSMKKSSGPNSGNCSSPYRMIDVANETEQKLGCVMQGRDIRFGYFSDPGYRAFVIGFSNDTKMYRINIGIGSYSEAIYSVSQDSLIIRRYIGGHLTHAGALEVYKNLSTSIRKSSNFSDNKTYELSKLEPDYRFMSKDNYPWAVEEYDISLNGDWVAMQLRSGGVGVLNVKTLEVKLIHPYYFIYNVGYDPFADFAISDDGKYVAMTGLNLPMYVFNINSECGYNLKLQYETNQNPCEMINIDTNIYSNLIVRYPKFNSNNNELSFYGVSPVDGGWYEAVLRTKNYVPPRLSYMALGDSYSSGEGELNDSNYLAGTNELNEKCHMSRLSYPFLISYKINHDQVKSVACSGAVTSDVIGFDFEYWGQGDRLMNLTSNQNLTEKNILQSIAKNAFMPGRIHQETFVKDYQPKVITIGIGGNDVGFADKLQACLGPDTCAWAGTIEGREKTAVEMKGLFNKLVTTYQKIQNDAPDAKIYAIGYPRFIDVYGECSSLRELLLDQAEREFIDEGIVYLNRIIEAAAKKTGIKYISIENSYGNYKMCGGGGQEAANFIKTGDDMGLPVDWLKWLKLFGQESFHPNALGHQLASASILNAVNGDIENYNYCVSLSPCPQDVTAPEPSSYWLPGPYHNYAEQKLVDFADNVSWTVERYNKVQTRLKKYALMPYSIINIEINSTPRSIGQFTVAADGSFSSDIDLPEDLEEGFHTIHIYGKSYSGENVDLYQVIRYFKPEPMTDIEPVILDNIVENTTKTEIVINPKPIINSSNQENDNVINLDDNSQMRDAFGVWSSGVLMDNSVTNVSRAEQSILSSSSTKKELPISEKSLSEKADNALNNVFLATICAMMIASLTAITARLYRRD